MSASGTVKSRSKPEQTLYRNAAAPTFVSRILPLNEQNFDRFLKSSNLPLLVDFWGNWCAPCRRLDTLLEDLSRRYAGKVTFTKVDVDTAPSIASRYDVLSLPTVMVFVNGAAYERVVGYREEEAYTRLLNSATSSLGPRR